MDRPCASLVLAIAALSFGERLFAFDGSERTLTRVRGADPEIHRLILEGDRRSPTFRKLVDEIQQSNAVVMIGFGLCRRDQFRSCVSHVAGDERQRHIRILVNTRTTSDRLVATIAHELQHAVEIISEPNVIDVESVSALYRRIGTGKCRQGLSEICETDAARLIEKQVAQELDDVGEHR